MQTAGLGWLNAALYVMALMLFLQMAGRLPRPAGQCGPRYGAAVITWLVVAVPSLLQERFHGFYTALHRDPGLIVHHHQWWRVVTSIVVQDGGWSGTIFNLTLLGLVMPRAVLICGPVVASTMFWGLGAVLNVLAALATAPPGGGNSGATFALAYGVIAGAWMRGDRLLRLLCLAALAVAVAVIIIDDAHGVAMLVGAAVGMTLELVARRAQPGRATRRPVQG